MKKIILLLLLGQCAFSQAPGIQWQKCIGGTGNDDIQSIAQTPDGGYIVGGYTSSTDLDATGSHGNYEILISKLSSSGVVQWSKVYGGSSYDRLHAIKATSDGGYVFCGYTYSTDGDVSGIHGNSDVWVVKLSAVGAIIWQKTFGGTNQDIGNDVIEVADGYVIAANTYSNNGNVSGSHGTTDAWVVKTDLTGTLQWQKAYGGSNYDNAASIRQTSDGGLVFIGSTNSNNGDVSGSHSTTTMDYWVVKTSSNGTLQWQKCFGGSADDEGNSIQQTTDGGYIASGYTASSDGNVTGFHGSKDFWIVKLGPTGSILFQKTFGGSQEDYSFKTVQTTDGGYISTGYIQSGTGDGDVSFNHSTPTFSTLDIWVIKLSGLGVLQWQTSLGNLGYQDAHDIQQTADGNFVVAGNTGNDGGDVSGFHGGNLDYWVVKLGSALGTENFGKKDVLVCWTIK